MVVIRRWWPVAALVVVVATALAAVMLADRPTPPLSSRVDQVAKTLRCRTCQGESVAASDTPIARSMRAQTRRQLQVGRSPDQVPRWFTERYGADIVTTPSTGGPELVLWALPAAVLALGGLLVLVRSRQRSHQKAAPGGPVVTPRALSGPRVLVAVAVRAAAGVAVPAAVALPSGGGQDGTPSARASAASARLGPAQWMRLGRSLDSRGDPVGAENAYRRALALAPRSPGARTRLAFDLLRGQDFTPAMRLVRPVAEQPGRYRPLALLVLGLAQRARGLPVATETLHTFLRVAPHHPAASQVRRLLGAR